MSDSADRGPAPEGTDFIRAIIAADDRYDGRVVTRFPPEPNGYPHIGHAKSIVLNFGIAQQTPGGVCHLRFDDTNPETEDMEYVEAFQRDIRWLGYDWNDRLFFASDYFEKLYEYAEQLIRDGKAYVCSLDEEEIRAYRGTVTEPGRESPYRSRSVEENLDLFRRMRAGEFPNGAHVLRAKIDMAAANMKMRDPLLYRIRHASHYRTGDAWCIYPMYDFTHCLSDSIENITHSICTLEFENNRELYDWILDNLPVSRPRPHQYEFARLNLNYTVMSKRRLLQLVERGDVIGWDDPRMPTIAGLRRRGYTPAAIRSFCERIGVARANSVVDVSQLEYSIRDALNHEAPRVQCVLRPLEVTLTNWPEGQVEQLDAPYWPHDVPKEGSRNLPVSGRLYIERDDFMREPAKGFKRLAPGREVRLRYGYVIRCDDVVEDDAGNVVGLRCSYDPETRGGNIPDGRKVKGTIHWVSADHAVPVQVKLYDRLFSDPTPDAHRDRDFKEFLNPESLVVIDQAFAEPSIAETAPGTHFQFERQGYFFSDPEDSKAGALVFNRTVSLKDGWAKITAREQSTVEAKAPATKAPERNEPKGPTRPRLVAETPSLVRLRDELGLSQKQAEVISTRSELGELFEAAIAVHHAPASVGKWVVNDLLGEVKDRPLDELPFGGAEVGALVAMIDGGRISGRIAKDVLEILLREGGSPEAIVRDRGLEQVTDAAAVGATIDEVLAAHPDELARYREGNAKLRGFFVGQVMKATGGKANPKLVNELLDQKLG